jgi:acyl-CoA reductase-like NAD-dependent aldehyde dehydrogenase
MTTVIDASARVFVDGRFRNAVEGQSVIEAATGEPLGNGSAATESEIDDAVAAARGSLAGWSVTPEEERAEVLVRFTDALVARATDVARAVRTGSIGVNDYALDLQSPFGGVKSSGIGRELGPEGLAAYQTLKSIYRVGPA